MSDSNPNITPQSRMDQILEAFPGAQRALFRRYHIGGCSSCAFHAEETLAALCERNNQLNPAEVLNHLQSAHAEDERMMIEPADLQAMISVDPSLKLLDIRTLEEWEAVHIEGAVRMSQEAMQDILGHWPREGLVVVYDHLGKQCLDAAAYFQGQGFQNVRCLRGGIDAWSRQVDSRLPRYQLA